MSALRRNMHMANKKMKKVPLDRECLMETLKLRNTSIRKLGKDYNFGWSSKSIERGIKDGEVSAELLDALGQNLDIEPDYLSGKYHRICARIADNDDVLYSILKKGLCAKKFPYLKKQQSANYDGESLYSRYLEYILIIHDISKKQFQDMTFEQQKEFQLSLEDAIVPVLIKYFSKNTMGEELYPEIYRLRIDIDNYDPDEPEPPNEFFLDEIDDSTIP